LQDLNADKKINSFADDLFRGEHPGFFGRVFLFFFLFLQTVRQIEERIIPRSSQSQLSTTESEIGDRLSTKETRWKVAQTALANQNFT
jgi:hypothetical protein